MDEVLGCLTDGVTQVSCRFTRELDDAGRQCSTVNRV